MRTILLIGEYLPDSEPHAATERSLCHAATRLQIDVPMKWISTTDITEAAVRDAAGIWIAPGSPYRDMRRALEAIRVAREEQIPCLGTCGGFQHMVIEYARNVLRCDGADHEEYDPDASLLFISRLTCSLAGRTLTLKFAAGSQIASIYQSLEASESYYCNFGVNPQMTESISRGPLRITGSDPEGEIRVLELPGHPFFIGTLFLPQLRSSESVPHPIVREFIRQASFHS